MNAQTHPHIQLLKKMHTTKSNKLIELIQKKKKKEKN